MAAIGLFALRMLIARPLVAAWAERGCGACRSRSPSPRASHSSPTPVYVDFSHRAVRPALGLRLGALVPLMRVSSFGRGYLDIELCVALFTPPPGSHSGSTGPTAPGARSPGFSPAGAAAAARRPRAPRPGRPRCPDHRRAGSSLLSTGSICSRARSGSAASSACSSSGARCRRPTGRRAGRLRPPLLERRLRRRDAADRLGDRGLVRCTCRRSPRCGRPRTARPCWSRSGCCSTAMLLAAVNLLRTKPRWLAARTRTELGEPPPGCFAGWSVERSCSSPPRSSRPRCSPASRRPPRHSLRRQGQRRSDLGR